MNLLIGPSNVGKSTWIEHHRPDEVCFAFQLVDGRIPPIGAVLHYNLLFLAEQRKQSGEALDEWNLLDDPILSRCLAKGCISEATVLVAPVKHLLLRAKQRELIENSLPGNGTYPAKVWTPIIQNVNLSVMYQQLFSILEDHLIPHQVLFNAQNQSHAMHEIERGHVDSVLIDNYVIAS